MVFGIKFGKKKQGNTFQQQNNNNNFEERVNPESFKVQTDSSVGHKNAFETDRDPQENDIDIQEKEMKMKERNYTG